MSRLAHSRTFFLVFSLALITSTYGCKDGGKYFPPDLEPRTVVETPTPSLPTLTPTPAGPTETFTLTPTPAGLTETFTLTPEPCIYFFEDFDDGNAQDGSPVTWLEENAEWSVVGGVYRVAATSTFNFSVCQEYADISDFILEYDVQLVGGYDRMVCPRWRTQNDYFFLNFRDWSGGDYYMEAYGFDGSYRQLCWSGGSAYPNNPNEWHHIKMGVIGYIFAIEIEGTWYASCEDAISLTPYGNIALAGHGGAATNTVEFDNVLMRCPTDTERDRILASNITTYTFFDTSGDRPNPAPWPPDTISGD